MGQCGPNLLAASVRYTLQCSLVKKKQELQDTISIQREYASSLRYAVAVVSLWGPRIPTQITLKNLASRSHFKGVRINRQRRYVHSVLYRRTGSWESHVKNHRLVSRICAGTFSTVLTAADFFSLLSFCHFSSLLLSFLFSPFVTVSFPVVCGHWSRLSSLLDTRRQSCRLTFCVTRKKLFCSLALVFFSEAAGGGRAFSSHCVEEKWRNALCLTRIRYGYLMWRADGRPVWRKRRDHPAWHFVMTQAPTTVVHIWRPIFGTWAIGTKFGWRCWLCWPA